MTICCCAPEVSWFRIWKTFAPYSIIFVIDLRHFYFSLQFSEWLSYWLFPEHRSNSKILFFGTFVKSYLKSTFICPPSLFPDIINTFLHYLFYNSHKFSPSTFSLWNLMAQPPLKLCFASSFKKNQWSLIWIFNQTFFLHTIHFFNFHSCYLNSWWFINLCSFLNTRLIKMFGANSVPIFCTILFCI